MRPLIGRRSELALLGQWLDAGHRVIGVTGPPGVGKSALLEALRQGRNGRAIKPAALPRTRHSLLCVDDWLTWSASARARLLAATSKSDTPVVLVSSARDVDVDATWLVVPPLDENESRRLLDGELMALGVTPLEGGGGALRRLLQLTFGFPALLVHLAHRLRSDSASALVRSLPEDDVDAFFGLSTEGSARSLRLFVDGLPKSARHAAEQLCVFERPFPLDAGRAVLESAGLDRETTSRALDALLDGQVLHLGGGDQRTAQLWGPLRAALIGRARRGRRWSEVERGFALALRSHGRLLDPRDLLNAAAWLAGAAKLPGYELDGLARVVGESLLLALAPPPGHGAEVLGRLATRVRDPSALTAVETARALAFRSGDQLALALDALDGLGPVLPRADPHLRARALEARAVCARRARRLEDARAAADGACALYRSLGSDRLCHGLGALAAIDLEEGALDDAYVRFSEVEALAERLGDERAALLAAAFRAHVEQERGHARVAGAGYRDVHLAFARRGEVWLASVYRGYEATALEECVTLGASDLQINHDAGPRVHPDVALEAYDDAIRKLEGLDAVSFATLFRAARAAFLAELGRPDHDRGSFAAALDDPAILAAVSIHKRRLEIARGLPPSTHSIGPVMRMRALSDDVRFALRRLARVRARQGEGTGTVLRLGAGKARVDRGPDVDLRKRRVLWRILERLVATHLDEAGRVTSSSLLLAAGWGDERMRKTAAAHRLRVAVSELRTLGLATAIERADGGYRVSPEVIVQMVGDAWDSSGPGPAVI